MAGCCLLWLVVVCCGWLLFSVAGCCLLWLDFVSCCGLLFAVAGCCLLWLDVVSCCGLLLLVAVAGCSIFVIQQSNIFKCVKMRTK